MRIALGSDHAGFALKEALKASLSAEHRDVIERLMAALQPDETLIGGGNVKKLTALPRRCRAGENANAFRGGFRLWK